jgi:hypothetical protein
VFELNKLALLLLDPLDSTQHFDNAELAIQQSSSTPTVIPTRDKIPIWMVLPTFTNTSREHTPESPIPFHSHPIASQEGALDVDIVLFLN